MEISQSISNLFTSRKLSQTRRRLQKKGSRNSIVVPQRPGSRHPPVITEPKANRKFSRQGSLKVIPQSKTFPMTPQEASRQLKRDGLLFEAKEVLAFKEVWYLPPQQFVKSQAFDDSKGFYKLYVGDHIAYRYEIKSFLGKGTFGHVCRCFDHKENKDVAVKIIKNKRVYHTQALVESKILEELRRCDPDDTCPFVKMKQFLHFRSHATLVFELLGKSLFTYIRNAPRISLNRIRQVGSQLLVALKVLKEHKIVHCDLKPDNILFTPAGTEIKVIDFGLGCFVTERVHYYIQSRFYRAPEVVLGIPYTMAIDMWSFGCILAEMYTGKPLFPCQSEEDLFGKMVGLLGAPPKDVVFEAKRKEVLHEVQLDLKSGELNFGDVGTLQETVGCANDDFTDLLKKCLEWNPARRITPLEALRHPFFSDLFK